MSVTIKHTGFAGHLIVADRCQFHRRTEIAGPSGAFVVSTVGAYLLPDKDGWTEVGYGRLYETMVFDMGEPCPCEENCGERLVVSWDSIDMRGYNDAAAASDGHDEMVTQYAERAA